MTGLVERLRTEADIILYNRGDWGGPESAADLMHEAAADK